MQFKVGKRVIRVTRCIFRRFRTRPGYRSLGSSPARNPMTKILTWGRKLMKGSRSLCSAAKKGSGYIPVGSDPVQDSSPAVPRGHLAVYVGQKDGEFHRVLVPVIYFNHPLFSELLREAEKEYGFQHPGGITIPCRYTEFERVKTRIASGSGVRRSSRILSWRRHC
ncbi:auxin-responsive protein SAUR36 [Gastrolobium bilobum]|uniref:auxin-responsive protein SAUR36 n=1 Tax=Gastrolobium bilobum TaxID=150636 RepID=UPI002AB2F517|nr:auxin-responsive protein SAUR36 [Gastrolobium bilobum]